VATSNPNPIELAAEIVTSFVSNNSLPRNELPALIEVVHAAVSRLAERREVVEAIIDAPAPAVSIRESITPDYLICLDDGKRFKSLRRHLTILGMTSEQYRAKWNLLPTIPWSRPIMRPNHRRWRRTWGSDYAGSPPPSCRRERGCRRHDRYCAGAGECNHGRGDCSRGGERHQEQASEEQGGCGRARERLQDQQAQGGRSLAEERRQTQGRSFARGDDLVSAGGRAKMFGKRIFGIRKR
jgi:predicted transcriptional regulator